MPTDAHHGRHQQSQVKAYYNRWLMLPKARFNIPSLVNALSYPIKSRGLVTGIIEGYKIDDDYFYAPREFFTEDRLKQLGLTVEYQLPDAYPKVSFQDKIVLDKKDPSKMIQRRAFAALVNNAHGVLSLGCGRGKTVLALKYMAFLQRPALVIVETTALISQWGDFAQQHLGLKDSQIGLVQGPVDGWDYEKPLVLATIQSLAKHHKNVPCDMRDRFGVIYFDEAHHLSARTFNRTASMFPGLRIGLSATPDRLDGL